VFKALQSLFDRAPGGQGSGSLAADERLRLATAALFVEMTRADFEVTEQERAGLEREVAQALSLSAEQTREIIELAEQEASAAIELFQFTRLIDTGFEPAEKIDLVERLWRLALADSRLDKHEEHLVRKVANLLHVPHREFIAAKLRARTAVESSPSKLD
jgi:uncharacterized tellurite resistance protein B-like protein